MIKKKYSNEIKDLQSKNINNEICYNQVLLKMDELTKSFFYDPGIILVIESFFQRQVYRRQAEKGIGREVCLNENARKIGRAHV